MSWDRGAPTPVVPNSHQARDARETGPLWACTCGSFNAASLSHCTKCGSLKPIERALRLQARAIQGLGRGGGYFERGDPTDRRKAEDEAEDKGGFDIYGRRRFAHSENTDERGEDATTSDATASVATAPEGGEAVDTASKNDAMSHGQLQFQLQLRLQLPMAADPRLTVNELRWKGCETLQNSRYHSLHPGHGPIGNQVQGAERGSRDEGPVSSSVVAFREAAWTLLTSSTKSAS
eukprot:CAMPEP_0172812458 /NCGR_PEP_ID=MMETSP1075-20121228/10058_1 /TAXON_ID=2916 /ORGANISM="Ceratium fusus, Strain PA161109" /LENGTH=234 /DNA_ID=CAMNT_0013652023 /DNA_START=19 /DNA_END=721 /DNA_ORIENTATION=-